MIWRSETQRATMKSCLSAKRPATFSIWKNSTPKKVLSPSVKVRNPSSVYGKQYLPKMILLNTSNHWSQPNHSTLNCSNKDWLPSAKNSMLQPRKRVLDRCNDSLRMTNPLILLIGLELRKVLVEPKRASLSLCLTFRLNPKFCSLSPWLGQKSAKVAKNR